MNRAKLESPASRNLKLIVMRILIAMYLMACAAGIAPGPSLVPTLSRLMPEPHAMAIGTALVFLPAYAMAAGIWLRASIHYLAIVLVLGTILEQFVFGADMRPGVLLQDIVTLCAMLQCLMLLKGRHFRHSSLVKKRTSIRKLEPTKRAEPAMPEFRPDAPSVIPMTVLNQPETGPEPRVKTYEFDEDEVVNIFAT